MLSSFRSSLRRNRQRRLYKMRRTTKMVNGKPPKNIMQTKTTFLLRKRFWVCKNPTTELGDNPPQTASRIRGGPPSPSIFPYIQVEILTQMLQFAKIRGFRHIKSSAIERRDRAFKKFCHCFSKLFAHSHQRSTVT